MSCTNSLGFPIFFRKLMASKSGDTGLNPKCFVEISLFLVKRLKTLLNMSVYRDFSGKKFGENDLMD